MSLRQRLLLSMTLVIALTLVIGSAVIYLHAVNKVETEMAAAISVGSRIAHNAVEDVEDSSDPERRLELVVADFNGDRHLKAMVVNPSGQAKLVSQPADPDEPAPWWFKSLLHSGNKSITVDLPKAFAGQGSFVLETQPYNEIAEAWDDTKKTLLLLGVLCVLAMALIYWILGRALSPLSDLSQSVSKIGHTANPPKMVEQGPNEFLKVYRGFNRMVDRLAEIERANIALSEQLNRVQEEERNALARDLHDEIGPFLFAVDVDAKSIEQIANEEARPTVSERVKRIRDAIAHMQLHLRDILGRLRSSEMIDLGLEHALDNLVSFWRRRYPSTNVIVEVPRASFGETVDQAFYRIAQESLNNAIRHGAPKIVTICVSRPEPRLVRLEVIDNGRGLVSERPYGTYGIEGMRERIELLGGRLRVENRKDASGVHVIAEVDLDDEMIAALDGDED